MPNRRRGGALAMLAHSGHRLKQQCPKGAINSGRKRTRSLRGTSCLTSGSSGARPQPSHDHVVRRSAAAWQAVSLDRGACKSQCLLAGLSFLARKCHPLANDGASHLWLGHLDSLSRSRRNPPWSEDTRVVQLFRSPDARATPPFGPDRPAIVAPKARNRIHARCRAR